MSWLVEWYLGLDAFCWFRTRTTLDKPEFSPLVIADYRSKISQFNSRSLKSRHVAQITFSVCRSVDHILASLRSTLPTGLASVNVHEDNAVVANGITHHPGNESTDLDREYWPHVPTRLDASPLRHATWSNPSPPPPRCLDTGPAV